MWWPHSTHAHSMVSTTPWLVQWSHHCSGMCIPVHSPWLPGYIDVEQTVLFILTMAGLFLDRPWYTLSFSQRNKGNIFPCSSTIWKCYFKKSGGENIFSFFCPQWNPFKLEAHSQSCSVLGSCLFIICLFYFSLAASTFFMSSSRTSRKGWMGNCLFSWDYKEQACPL